MKFNPQYPCPNCQKNFTQTQLRPNRFSSSLKCPHCQQKLRGELPKKHLYWLFAGLVLIILLIFIKTLFPDFISKSVGDALSLAIFLYCGAWHGLQMANKTIYHKSDD